ncbi:MAG: hypothetical protein ACM31O_01320 [Bacteroidota bacterium]|jgi:hypothetical protein
MSKTSIAAAVAAALAFGALAAPAAEAHGKHHRFFFKPYHYSYVYKPVCGKWFWSRRYDRWVCAWYY